MKTHFTLIAPSSGAALFLSVLAMHGISPADAESGDIFRVGEVAKLTETNFSVPKDREREVVSIANQTVLSDATKGLLMINQSERPILWP